MIKFTYEYVYIGQLNLKIYSYHILLPQLCLEFIPVFVAQKNGSILINWFLD